jgi:PAS domain S-box-containing protein
MAPDSGVEKQQLQRSEERFRLLVESVRDYAIFMLDPNGVVLTWNAGAERFKGYRADEIVGRHFFELLPFRSARPGPAGARTESCERVRHIRRRGLACPQGRFALLGERGHDRHTG